MNNITLDLSKELSEIKLLEDAFNKTKNNLEAIAIHGEIKARFFKLAKEFNKREKNLNFDLILSSEANKILLNKKIFE